MQMREELKAKRDETINYPGDDTGAGRTIKRPHQAKGAIRAEGHPQKAGDAENRKRLKAQSKEREEQQCYSVVVLAECECVFKRIKDVRVKQIERIVECLVKVPPECPRDVEGIAGIGHATPQLGHPGPGHQRRDCNEKSTRQNFSLPAGQFLQLHQPGNGSVCERQAGSFIDSFFERSIWLLLATRFSERGYQRESTQPQQQN